MTLIDLSSPPSPAVSLDAAKTFLRIDHSDEDALITDLIDAATLQIEDRCGVSLNSLCLSQWEGHLPLHVSGACTY